MRLYFKNILKNNNNNKFNNNNNNSNNNNIKNMKGFFEGFKNKANVFDLISHLQCYRSGSRGWGWNG